MWYFKLSAITFLIYFVIFWIDRTTPKNHLLSWLSLLLVA